MNAARLAEVLFREVETLIKEQSELPIELSEVMINMVADLALEAAAGYGFISEANARQKFYGLIAAEAATFGFSKGLAESIRIADAPGGIEAAVLGQIGQTLQGAFGPSASVRQSGRRFEVRLTQRLR